MKLPFAFVDRHPFDLGVKYVKVQTVPFYPLVPSLTLGRDFNSWFCLLFQFGLLIDIVHFVRIFSVTSRMDGRDPIHDHFMV